MAGLNQYKFSLDIATLFLNFYYEREAQYMCEDIRVDITNIT